MKYVKDNRENPGLKEQAPTVEHISFLVNKEHGFIQNWHRLELLKNFSDKAYKNMQIN